MCAKNIHYKKYKKNKQLMNCKTIKENQYNDWRSIIIFYAALHIVDCSYAEMYHPKNHVERKNFVQQVACCKPIYEQYKLLESLSRKARYQAFNIQDDELSEAMVCFTAIEKQLKSYFPQ